VNIKKDEELSDSEEDDDDLYLQFDSDDTEKDIKDQINKFMNKS
jgi:hypothetical protein